MRVNMYEKVRGDVGVSKDERIRNGVRDNV